MHRGVAFARPRSFVRGERGLPSSALSGRLGFSGMSEANQHRAVNERVVLFQLYGEN